MKKDEYEEIYDEDSPDYWAQISNFESESVTFADNFTIDDISNIKSFPCPDCNTQMPNDDGIFICPKCGTVVDKWEIYDAIKGY